MQVAINRATHGLARAGNDWKAVRKAKSESALHTLARIAK
jgi:hypothetical protein